MNDEYLKTLLQVTEENLDDLFAYTGVPVAETLAAFKQVQAKVTEIISTLENTGTLDET